MKKIIYTVIITLLVEVLGVLCYREYNNYKERFTPFVQHHRMIKETIIEYNKEGRAPEGGGVYKKIYRNYDYTPYDSISHYYRIDDMHEIHYYTSYYGDTLSMIYTDYTNFPRREE